VCVCVLCLLLCVRVCVCVHAHALAHVRFKYACWYSPAVSNSCHQGLAHAQCAQNCWIRMSGMSPCPVFRPGHSISGCIQQALTYRTRLSIFEQSSRQPIRACIYLHARLSTFAARSSSRRCLRLGWPRWPYVLTFRGQICTDYTTRRTFLFNASDLLAWALAVLTCHLTRSYTAVAPFDRWLI